MRVIYKKDDDPFAEYHHQGHSYRYCRSDKKEPCIHNFLGLPGLIVSELFPGKDAYPPD